jgi:outer membrane protein assembly factor BamB
MMNAKLLSLHTVALLNLSVLLLPVVGDDWPNWRGPNHDGISKETGWTTQWPAEGPKKLWEATVGTGFGIVSVSKGRVYTMGNAKDTDTVFCLDADTGAVKWKHSYPCKLDPQNFEGGPGATPTVDGNVVYTFSRFGDALALDAESGKVIWSKNLLQELGAERTTWGLAGSVLIEGTLAIYNVGRTGAALDKGSGKVVWKSEGVGGYSTPVPFGQGGQRALVMFSAQTVVGVAVATGQKLWEHRWKTEYDVNAADPIVSGATVFVSSGYGRGCSLIKVTGGQTKTVWENRNMRNHFANCVLVGDYIYGFDGNTGGGGLKCLDLATGAVKWSQERLTTGGLMVADGKIVALADGGKLIIAAASPDGFKQLASANPVKGRCWTMPVLANGRIYCKSNKEGHLVCLDVK